MFSNSRARRVSGSVIPLGFILVVTIITLALVLFTTTTLPTLSKSAEIDAHRSVGTDFIRMDSAVYRAATTGIPQPVVIGNRVQYPPSITPLKTPTPLLRTVGPHNISVENAVYAENTTSYTVTRPTSQVVFSRDYNFFTTARDFGYEHGIFYTQAPDAAPGEASILARDQQTIITGRTITFVTLDGDLSFSRPAPTQVALSSDSDEELHDTVTSVSGQHIELVIPTRLPESEWDGLLAPERYENGGHITGVQYQTTHPITGADDGINYVVVELESGVEYHMNFYTVGLEKY